MTYQIAIARFRSSPTIFSAEYATLDQARASAEQYWREGLRGALRDDGALSPRFQNRPTGDYYVVPCDGIRRTSQQIRDDAAFSLAGRNWRDAFTAAEIAAWEAARESA